MRLSASKFPLCTLLLSLLTPLTTAADSMPPAAAIASAHPLATEAGFEILAQGGNAFDAAVAVSAALAVVEPYSSGMGGGGFWLLHQAKNNRDVMIDGREKAPLSARHDMYLDQQGNFQRDLAINGPTAAGIPGQAAALAHLQTYGQLTLAKTLAPAIKLAQQGFAVESHYQKLAGFRKAALQRYSSTSQLFLVDGDVPPTGHTIVQTELADTLSELAIHGHEGFYSGKIANALVKSVNQNGGNWSLDDLSQYQIVERLPITGRYQQHQIISAPPPSSGGILLVSMLNILSGYPQQMAAEANFVTKTHLIVEAMRRSYRDRALYLGDSDFIDIPVERLTHPYYAEGLRTNLLLNRATPSTSLVGISSEAQAQHTTHFSILDQQGNYVAATLSINYPFGSAFVAEGTGVLLNDEMDDFSAKPGEPNVYGLVGSQANAIAPGKRMLSSMTPTFLRNDEQIAILGTPGGSRIITMVLLGALEFVDQKEPNAWVERPRFHHQYLPDVIEHETAAFTQKQQQSLQQMGHQLKPMNRQYGNMHAILWDKKNQRVLAASDPRGIGLADTRIRAK